MIENKNSLNEHETIVAPFKPDEEEPYIFISYSHKDRNRVFPIITRLYEKGWRIWYDEGIEVTENYYTSISRHIRKCTVFLLFVTENSVKSEFVCEHELLLAASYRKIMAICRLDENAQFTDEAGDAIALATISSKNPKTDETGLENALSNIAELKKFPPRKAVGYKIRRNNTDIILADEDDEYDFEVCDDGIRLTGYNGNSEIVHVPIIYKGQPVIELDDPFRCSQTIKKIYIPEGVKKVTVSTFLCSNLSDIYIPESLDIQDVAFFNISIHCSNNTKFKQGIIQDNVKIIYDYNKFERNTKCPTKKYTFCIYSVSV